MEERSRDGQEVIMRFWEAAERGDLTSMRALTADDVMMTWPQSGERFRGRDNAFAAMGAIEEQHVPAGEPRIVGGGDVWVVMMPMRFGQEAHEYVGVFELRDGRIAASTEYFAAPFPPSAARATFSEGERQQAP